MESFLTTKDFLVSGEEFQLKQDQQRELLITSPQPTDLGPYYKSKDYISHTDSKRGVISVIYQWVKKYSTARKLKLFDRYAGENKTLLDIGAGTGDLLLAAKRKGYDISGVEPNISAREKAESKGVQLKTNYEFDRKFQIISLWHVIEHLPNPAGDIQKIKELLDDEGALFVAAPNFKSLDAEYYREFWAAYDVPRHLWHFSRTSMRKLFEEHQMEIIEIKPMIFDAFYVSLLSEKYMTGKSNLLKAFRVGMESNMKARRNGEYSSLLYIIKKGK